MRRIFIVVFLLWCGVAYGVIRGRGYQKGAVLTPTNLTNSVHEIDISAWSNSIMEILCDEGGLDWTSNTKTSDTSYVATNRVIYNGTNSYDPLWQSTTNGATYGTNSYFHYVSAGSGNEYIRSSSSDTLDSINGTKPFTIMVWLKTTSATNYGASTLAIFSFCENSNPINVHDKTLVLGANGIYGFYCWSGATEWVLSNSTNNGTWTHLAGVYNGTTMYMYRDGVVQTDTEACASTFNYTAPIIDLGGSKYSCGQYDFDGDLDDAKIFNSALSSNIIYSIYSSTKHRYGL